jgi:hypothetical protein
VYAVGNENVRIELSTRKADPAGLELNRTEWEHSGGISSVFFNSELVYMSSLPQKLYESPAGLKLYLRNGEKSNELLIESFDKVEAKIGSISLE